MFSSERNEVRKIFFTTWEKYQKKQLLEPLEAQIIDVILLHPEFHDLLSDPERYQDKDFPESNPFFHLGLHLSIREQINTNRPQGIKEIYQILCSKFSDTRIAEHKLMECLEKTLWEAQQSGVMPEEESYLAYLRKMI